MAIKRPLGELELHARKCGFESYKAFLHEHYVVRNVSLIELAEMLHIHTQRVRKHLLRYGIAIRGRGGPNNCRVVLTPALVSEVIRDGIPAVSERLGVTQHVLRMRVTAYFNAQRR